jgi:hypothetical protein
MGRLLEKASILQANRATQGKENKKPKQEMIDIRLKAFRRAGWPPLGPGRSDYSEQYDHFLPNME